ncbi:MAG TPA: hypothetical protein VN306_08425 [Mycobacterium sp.]|nr:hypothetical protein [Mycobacterium sp.]
MVAASCAAQRRGVGEFVEEGGEVHGSYGAPTQHSVQLPLVSV